MIDLSVNFKTKNCVRELCHCFGLIVTCYEFDDRYDYSVEALAHGFSSPVRIRSGFDTPEEAFAYAKQIAAANPPYGDKRDYDYSQVPPFRDPDIEGKDGEKSDKDEKG